MGRPNTNTIWIFPTHAEIRTKDGIVIKVDVSDVNELSKHSWYVQSNGYAYTRIDGKCVAMHRLLLNAVDKNEHIDHVNHDTLDNRRCNLRRVSPQENQFNRIPGKNNRSGVVGVHFNKECGKWCAQLTLNRRCVSSTLHDSFEGAVEMRKELEKIYFDKMKEVQ